MLYMDQHVPLAITLGLRDRGIDVLTANEDGYSDRSDQELLERVLELERIIFMQDADFLSLACNHWAAELSFPTVVYGHQLRITIGQAIHDLEIICQTLETQETINQLIYLPL